MNILNFNISVSKKLYFISVINSVVHYYETSVYDYNKIYLVDKEEEDTQSSMTSLRSGSKQPKIKLFFLYVF